MTKQQHLLIIFLVVVASILHDATTTSAAATTTSSAINSTTTLAAAATAYDVLEQNDLPRGLLPLGVQSYALDRHHVGGGGGALEVTLRGECYFFVPVADKPFKFRYGSRVTGVVRPGSISRLSGMRMQVESAWVGINHVTRRSGGDEIDVQLEMLSAQPTRTFPVSSFSRSPRCGEIDKAGLIVGRHT